MNTRFRTLRTTVLAALLAGGLAGLSGCGGGGATYQAASNQTLGKELQDLQQAYEKDIITKKEYERAKKDLMKKHTR